MSGQTDTARLPRGIVVCVKPQPLLDLAAHLQDCVEAWVRARGVDTFPTGYEIDVILHSNDLHESLQRNNLRIHHPGAP